MSRLAPGLVVAVTGASAGIGRATAFAFARAGARLALGARRLDRLEALAEALRTSGADVLVRALDVGVQAEVAAFVRSTVDRFGRLDVLVNNAGYGVRGRVEDVSAEAYERILRVNFLGTVYGCQAAVPVMRRQGSGVIVNVSSVVGLRALPNGGAYAATKAAQHRLTEALRVELRGSGVHACTVHPVGTSTEFAEVASRESGTRRGEAPLGPQQDAAVVAAAIVDGVRRRRAEIYPLGPARAIGWLNALAPRLVDWLAWRSARSAGRI